MSKYGDALDKARRAEADIVIGPDGLVEGAKETLSELSLAEPGHARMETTSDILGFEAKDDWDRRVLGVAGEGLAFRKKVDVWRDEDGKLQVAIDGCRQALEQLDEPYPREKLEELMGNIEAHARVRYGKRKR